MTHICEKKNTRDPNAFPQLTICSSMNYGNGITDIEGSTMDIIRKRKNYIWTPNNNIRTNSKRNFAQITIKSKTLDYVHSEYHTQVRVFHLETK